MSSIKLKHSGGNSVSIAAPTSNPSADRTLLLPGNANSTIDTLNRAGNILQVQHNFVTDQMGFATSSTSYVTHSNLPTLSITPTISSNLILAQTNLKAVSYHNTGNSAKQDFYISADGGSSYAERVRSWSYRYDTGGIYLEQPIVVWYIAVAGSTSAKNFKVYHASGTNLQVDINYNSAGSELTDTSHLFLWEIEP